MNGPILTLLAVIVAGLLLLGALGAVLRRRAREAIGFGSASLGGLAAILALLALALREDPTELVLPLGLPGAAFHLLLDPLSAFFALLVFAAGTAAIVHAAEADPSGSPNSLAGMPVALGGLALAAVAGDAFVFAAGLTLAGGAIWATGRAEEATPPTPAVLALTLLAAASVIGAATVLGGRGALLGPVTERASAALTADAPAALLLTLLIGLVPLAGLVPLQRWIVAAQQAAPPRAAAILAGAAMPLAFEALIRLLFPARPLPPWCGLILLVPGAASMLVGGFQATREDSLDGALAAGTVRQAGVMAAGLGVALTARAQDLPTVAALGLAAVLLGAATQAVCGTLAVLAAGAIRRGAGTRYLSRLGGVIHRMPASTAGLLAALFGLAALPPGVGFATYWLVFQALLAEVQSNGPGLQAVFVVTEWVLGLGAALATTSLVRLVGVACLGRPRTPRAAAADPPPSPARVPLLCLAGASVGLGVLSGPVLRWLADPAIAETLGAGLGPRAGLLGVTATQGGRGYAVLPIVVLLALAMGVVVWLRRRLQPASTHSGPAWDGGFAAAPAWLPFGDPQTQSAGAGFTPLPDELPRISIRYRKLRWHPVTAPAVAVGILALLLIVLRWLPP